MKTSEPFPAHDAAPQDLAAIAGASGPFLSVYMPVEQAIDRAAHRAEVRWKDLRRELEPQRVPAQLLDQIDALVPEAHFHGACLGVVATEQDGIVLTEHGPGTPCAEVGRWDGVPSLIPILEWRQSHIPYLMVLADRTGADLVGVTRERATVEETAEGTDDVIHKPHAGGWSMRRYQQRAEDSWERNAEAVAREAASLASRLKAELIVGAGDVRALAYFKESIPVEWRPVYRDVAGSRGANGSERHVREQAEEEVAQEVARRTDHLLMRLREEIGQGDLGCEGAGPTIAALAAAQVELLFVDPGSGQDRTAWYGPEPVHVAADPETLHTLGVAEPREAPLLDVLVRAALGTGAGVRVLPDATGALAGGVGALLRWGAAPAAPPPA